MTSRDGRLLRDLRRGSRRGGGVLGARLPTTRLAIHSVKRDAILEYLA